MSGFFISLFNMSVTAILPILLITIFRAVFKKVPRSITCVLWSLAALRLIIPDFIESNISLIPSAETVPQNIIYADIPTISSGISYLNSVVNPVIGSSLSPSPGVNINPMQTVVNIASVIWVVGMALILSYAAVSYISIRLKVRESIEDNGVFICDNIPSPFILGIFRPRIYLPSQIAETDREYVIAHEKCHLKRLDHIIKPIAFILLTIYWFNPFVWLAYILISRDIEFACDEGVIRRMGSEFKKGYSEALINCSAPSKLISACPLAFGEVGVKSRIRQVLNYKKPAFWIIVLALITAIVFTVCLLTNPKKDDLPIIHPFPFDTSDGDMERVTLTIDDIIELSKKGEDLTWSDFRGYYGYDVGSGLYIMRYDIDELFYVLVGGGSITEKPLYITLNANTVGAEWTDVTQGEVKSFIDDHKHFPVAKRISTGWQIASVGYDEKAFNRLCTLYGIPKDAIIDRIKSLHSVKITSISDLNNFMLNLDGYMDFDRHHEDTFYTFREIASEYKDDFFEENTLFLIYMTSSYPNTRFRIEDAMVIDEKEMYLSVSEYYPTSANGDIEGWLAVYSVPNNIIEDVTTVRVHQTATIHTDSILGGVETIKEYYVFRDSQEVIKPSVILFESGISQFTISGLSSYLGLYNYTVDGDILKLTDTRYTYVFKITDNGIIFSEKDSVTGNMWGITDGCFFEKTDMAEIS